MTPRIENAINVFLKALEQGTLAKAACTACAVGNLVADGMNHDINLDDDYKPFIARNAYWGSLFTTTDGKQRISDPDYLRKLEYEKAVDNIESTEFTQEELMAIEYAFETNTEIIISCYKDTSKQDIRADQMKGLEAVVEVMMDFDDVKDSIQEVFTSKAELIPCK